MIATQTFDRFALLVSGSRKATPDMLDYAWSVVRRAKFRGWMILVGDAEGIDETIIGACKAEGVPFVVYGITDQPRNGSTIDRYIRISGDYLDRDRHMAKLCDRAIGIWNGKSRGTEYTIRQAKRYGKPTDLVNFISGRPVQE